MIATPDVGDETARVTEDAVMPLRKSITRKARPSWTILDVVCDDVACHINPQLSGANIAAGG
jgi:hypothetical protein